MKSLVFLTGLFLSASLALADATRHVGTESTGFVFDDGTILVRMSSCETNDPRDVFSLYRHPDNSGLGFLYDYHHGRLAEHIVEINYTNAGARAIVTSKEVPMLILFGTGKEVIKWDGRTWTCHSDF